MKKHIAILLVLVMLTGVLPLSVYANNDNSTAGNLKVVFTKILEGTSEMFKRVARKFSDMGNHWAKDHIHTLVLKDIIVKSEYGTNFRPNKNITRIEMAKMIVRALGLDKQAKENVNASTKFNDNFEINGTDRGYVLIASENKIISGYPDGNFRPNGEANRAEASQMIVNMFSALERGIDTGEDTTTQTEPTPPPTDDTKPVSEKDRLAHLYEYKTINFYGEEVDVRYAH